MVVHRDHGWSDGWGTPGYGTADVQALTNGAMLPVVMSINCSSAAFDYDETSFVGEALVNPNGGAVGAFGDTRDSPSTANTQISLGFADALLPFILPSEGPATRQRTGNALIHGKLRLNGIAPLPNGTTRSEFYLWHYFGDPTMQMWGARDPIVLDPNIFAAVFKKEIGPPPPDPPPYWVQVTLPSQFNGQAFSLLRRGEVIGKGVATGGNVNIPASLGDGPDTAGQLQVALEADGYVPVLIPVKDEPPLTTTLSQQCPANVDEFHDEPFTITGQLQPGFAGATIKITYTSPSGLRRADVRAHCDHECERRVERHDGPIQRARTGTATGRSRRATRATANTLPRSPRSAPCTTRTAAKPVTQFLRRPATRSPHW